MDTPTDWQLIAAEDGGSTLVYRTPWGFETLSAPVTTSAVVAELLPVVPDGEHPESTAEATALPRWWARLRWWLAAANVAVVYGLAHLSVVAS